MENSRQAGQRCPLLRTNSETVIFQAAMFTRARRRSRSEWKSRSSQKTCRPHMPERFHMAHRSFAPLYQSPGVKSFRMCAHPTAAWLSYARQSAHRLRVM